MENSEILFAANYRYNLDRDLFVNRQSKKAFSLEFVDDSSPDEIRRRIAEDTDENFWKFYFLKQPSPVVRKLLEEDLEAA